MLPIAWQADCDVLLCVKSYKHLCLNRLNLRHRRSKQRDIRCLGTAAHKRLLPSIFLHFHLAVLGFQNIYRYILSASKSRCIFAHLSWKMLYACTCFFTTPHAILRMEKNRCSERRASESSVFAFYMFCILKNLWSLKECCSWRKNWSNMFCHF